jgi:predicted RND superfamily exporter protein
VEYRDRIELGFERWGHVVFRYRWLTIALMVLATVVFCAGAGRLRFEASTENYLDPKDPARVAYDAFRRQFVNDNTILIILHAEKVFSFDFLEKLKSFHDDLERKIPQLEDVTSLINARVTRGSQDELIVEELLERWPKNEAELAMLAARARGNPVYVNTLISEDARYTTVTIDVTPGGDAAEKDVLEGFAEAEPDDGGEIELPPILKDEELDRVMQALLEVVNRHESDDFPIWITGNPEMTWALSATAQKDMTRFGLLTEVLIALLLFLLFRRFSGVALPVLIVTLPLMATLGIMGWVGLPLTLSTQQLPSLLIAVCVGDSVHVLVIFYRRFDSGSSKEDAMSFALGHSGLAVLMTTLTTVGGLGSFLFADLAPVAGLGIAAPTGVTLALVYSVALLPALVAVLPLRPRRGIRREAGQALLDRVLAGIGDLSARHPWSVVTVWCLLVLMAIYGAAQLRIAYKPIEWFPEDFPSRVAAEIANRELQGLMPLEVVVDTGHENGLHSPELMRRMERMQTFAKSLDVDGTVAGQAISLVDILKETHQALNENDPRFYAVPQDRELVAQELLLFDNSGSDDLEELVDSGFGKGRISLLVSYEDGLRYLRFVQEVEAGADEIIGDLAEVETTGLVTLWVRTISAMLSTTAKSYSIALLVIAPLMILLIGELRMGLISLIPNLTPIVMGMGIMHWVGIDFDMFTMMIGSIAIGMAVDDTIHFMHGFRRHYRRGADAPTAVRETLLTTGRALLITSLALSTGFFVQVFGTLISVQNCGLITAFVILGALVADLSFAPALVTLSTRFSERKAAKLAACSTIGR